MRSIAESGTPALMRERIGVHEAAYSKILIHIRASEPFV